jgi:DNA-binding LacI/PurR family transcriptional regulator
MNLEEVAKRAGVSTATVSRVLNNLDVVRSATRARVLAAVAELKYHPNLHARTLAGGKSHTIGMIASNMENPFFFDIFRSLEAHARNAGFDVIVANTGYDPGRLVRHVRLMIGRRVAGLAMVVSEMDPTLIDELAAACIPCVFYDVGAARDNITNIRAGYRPAVHHIVAHLHSLGHRRFAFIGHHSSLGPTSERQMAFLEAVSQLQPAVAWQTAAADDGFDGGRDAARSLLDRGFSPTAIVCVNDFTAVGVLRELRSRGLRVPHDVSLTGFDNIRLSEYCDPPLTTVDIPREEIGRLAFSALAPACPAATPGREIVIEPRFILRASTAPPQSSTNP